MGLKRICFVFLFSSVSQLRLLLASFGNRVPLQSVTMIPTLIHTSFSTVLKKDEIVTFPNIQVRSSKQKCYSQPLGHLFHPGKKWKGVPVGLPESRPTPRQGYMMDSLNYQAEEERSQRRGKYKKMSSTASSENSGISRRRKQNGPLGSKR